MVQEWQRLVRSRQPEPDDCECRGQRPRDLFRGGFQFGKRPNQRRGGIGPDAGALKRARRHGGIQPGVQPDRARLAVQRIGS